MNIFIEEGFIDGIDNDFKKNPDYKYIKFLEELLSQQCRIYFDFPKPSQDVLEDLSSHYHFWKELYGKETIEREWSQQYGAVDCNIYFVKDESLHKKKRNNALYFDLKNIERKICEFQQSAAPSILENKNEWKTKFNQIILGNSDIVIVDPYFFNKKSTKQNDFIKNFFTWITHFQNSDTSSIITILTQKERFLDYPFKNFFDDVINSLQKKAIKIEVLDSTLLRANNTQETACNTVSNCFNWHDREVFTDFGLITAGSGFKNFYDSNTNIKSFEITIFHNGGFDLVKKHKELLKNYRRSASELKKGELILFEGQTACYRSPV